MSARAGSSADRRPTVALLVAVLAVAPAACKQADAVEVEHYQASKITPAEDGSGHPVVTLTELGARQIELETEAVERKKTPKPTTGPLGVPPTAPKPAKAMSTIPYAAVLYDGKDGQAYVFVNTEGLSFHREDITIENIDGQVVDISKGPEVGARVATVGIAQIHGAELEYGAY